jgi:hypothetical protein
VSNDGSPGIASISENASQPTGNQLIIVAKDKNRILEYSMINRKIDREVVFKEFPFYEIAVDNHLIYGITNNRIIGFIKVVGWDHTIMTRKS